MSNTLGGSFLAAIAEQTLDYMGREFVPLSAFTRNFSQDILDQGESVTTRVPSSVAAQNLATGYTSTDVQTTSKQCTLSNFKGFVYGFKDAEASKAGDVEFLHRTFVAPAIEATAQAVLDSLLALVTNSNFSASTTITSSNFDSDDLADLSADLSNSKVNKALRSALISPVYNSSLQKDVAIQDASKYGNSSAIRDHQADRIHGFGIHEYSSIPTNSENLAGFVCHPSALIIAARAPATPVHPSLTVVDSVESVTGIPLQFRQWYDRDNGEHKVSVGLLFGVQIGNPEALKRILSA